MHGVDSRTTGERPSDRLVVERIVGPFVDLIAEGQRAGDLRDDHDPAFLAQMAVGMMNSTITAWLADPDHPVESGLVEAAEFALATLRPPEAAATPSPPRDRAR